MLFALQLPTDCLALHAPLHHVDMHADPARPGTLHKLLHELVPDWVASAGGVKIKQLSGGLTNTVIRARPATGSAGESLLLRVFGEGSERMLDRDKELSALHNQCFPVPPTLAASSPTPNFLDLDPWYNVDSIQYCFTI